MAKLLTLEIYRDKKKMWRWRLKSRNNRILADGGEGYKRKSGVLHAVKVITTTPTAIKYL
jgi:uncharacterized protein YegP (UPF0339 family)